MSLCRGGAVTEATWCPLLEPVMRHMVSICHLNEDAHLGHLLRWRLPDVTVNSLIFLWN